MIEQARKTPRLMHRDETKVERKKKKQALNNEERKTFQINLESRSSTQTIRPSPEGSACRARILFSAENLNKDKFA